MEGLLVNINFRVTAVPPYLHLITTFFRDHKIHPQIMFFHRNFVYKQFLSAKYCFHAMRLFQISVVISTSVTKSSSASIAADTWN